MSERDQRTTAAKTTRPAERREENDRRGFPLPNRRGRSRPGRWKQAAKVVGRDAAIVFGSLAAILAAVHATHPIYTNQPSVVASLLERTPVAPLAKAVLDTLPPDSTLERIVASPEFERDRIAFAADLVSTGHMDPSRADSVAYYAVREAYYRGIPPAVVFGVMLTENSRFVSSALSNVGAVGLMQVYPKVWLSALQKKFGSDLANDSTNLKYGVYILSTYIKTDQGKAVAEAVNRGLLHYNGCVKGTNTPQCHNYPSKVAGYVNKQGNAICANKSFYQCIAQPFLSGLFGKKE